MIESIVQIYEESTRRDRANRALETYCSCSAQTIKIPRDVLPQYQKLAEAIRHIESAGEVSRDRLLQEFPELAPHVRLLDQCLANCEDIMTGKKDHLSVLFPEGSLELVADIYQHDPASDYFNGAVAKMISNLQRERQGQMFRILELGAGTGSTTKNVLPLLDPQNSRYTFTDLSLGFTNHGRRIFKQYPFVEFRILNIEQPPPELGGFDVVLATNVLHATHFISTTLRNIRKLLADDGVLIISEVTKLQHFATLTFGLTAGWWLHEDSCRIQYSPLLSGETWKRLLKESSYGTIVTHGTERQQVIVCERGRDT